jgi:hypothetical protein
MSYIKQAVQAIEELEAMWNVYEGDGHTQKSQLFMRYAITEHTAHIKKQLGLNDVAFAEAQMIYADYRETAGELSIKDSLEIANPLFRYYDQPWTAAQNSKEVAA